MLSIRCLVPMVPTSKNFIIYHFRTQTWRKRTYNFYNVSLPRGKNDQPAKLPPKRNTVPFDETIKRNASHAHNFISGNVYFITYTMTAFTWNHQPFQTPLPTPFFLPRHTCVSICGHCTLLHVPRPFTEGPRNTATLNNLFSQGSSTLLT